MQILNNQLYVQQGEAFSLDFLIKNKDDAPYIVSSALIDRDRKAYYLLTISGKSPDPEKRYILNKWLPLRAEDTFYCTVPVKISSLQDFDYSAMKQIAANDGVILNNYCVWYTEDDLGVRHYYRYCGDDTVSNYVYNYARDMTPYENRVTVSFTSEESLEWGEQSYTYSVQLVSGPENINREENEAPIIAYNNIYNIMAPTSMVVTNANIRPLNIKSKNR